MKFKIRFAFGRAVAFSCCLFVSSEVGVWLPPFAAFNISPNFFLIGLFDFVETICTS